MESVWTQTCKIPPRASLTHSVEADAAVIGAGMAGILIASALQSEGRRVVVLEAGRIGSGQTAGTTAKISSQHGLFCSKLIETFGTERASKYAAANQAALAEFRRIITGRGIDCEYEELPSYVFGDDAASLRAEAEAARSLGLPASYTESAPLPIPAAGAVRFENQAQFHPLRFLDAMAEGLEIYENSPVLSIEDGALKTPLAAVRAQQLVFACHFPFVNFPGMYFARMHQERSYIIALENAPLPEGVFIGAEEPVFSLRRSGKLLLLGGGKHRTGENSSGGRCDILRQKAAERFPGSREVAHWSAQDCITPDGAPYIGRFSASRPDWFVATGFNKWGMSSSMVAAMLLPDLMAGRESPNAEAFSPSRFEAEAVPAMAENGAQAVKGLVRRFFEVPDEAAADIRPGHGGIVELGGEKVGVYRDENGAIHAVDIRCPHLGCQLEWNGDELSWDCPCHGSRFDRFGARISGPAQEDIASQP